MHCVYSSCSRGKNFLSPTAKAKSQCSRDAGAEPPRLRFRDAEQGRAPRSQMEDAAAWRAARGGASRTTSSSASTSPSVAASARCRAGPTYTSNSAAAPTSSSSAAKSSSTPAAVSSIFPHRATAAAALAAHLHRGARRRRIPLSARLPSSPPSAEPERPLLFRHVARRPAHCLPGSARIGLETP
jgi:hypothetical protein